MESRTSTGGRWIIKDRFCTKCYIETTSSLSACHRFQPRKRKQKSESFVLVVKCERDVNYFDSEAAEYTSHFSYSMKTDSIVSLMSNNANKRYAKRSWFLHVRRIRNDNPGVNGTRKLKHCILTVIN